MPATEPPLIERARRAGWALLGLALACAVLWRSGNAGVWTIWVGGAAALIGGLAILNVLLVRALYRQVANAPRDNSPRDRDQSM